MSYFVTSLISHYRIIFKLGAYVMSQCEQG